MSLFSDRLVEDMRRLEGAQHSFLQQLCGPRAGRHRSVIESLVERAARPLAERAEPLLTSLDNRRFFQGYAELAVSEALSRGRLRVTEVAQPGAYLQASGWERGPLNIAVLSFIHKARPEPDQASVARLVAALNRVGSRQRLVVVVHGRLPHDFDTEEIRRAVETWLGEVERGQWQGRYATFIDDKRGIHLEFGLTGRSVRRGPRVCFAIGPFPGPVSLAAAEPRILDELGRYGLGPHAGKPLLLVCASDQPWAVSPGYMRDFLFGQPRCIEGYRDGGSSDMELRYGHQPSATLFRDPVYSDLCGLLWLSRRAEDPSSVEIEAYLNPWSRHRLEPDLLPSCPVLAQHRRQDGDTVLRWFGDRAERAVSLI